MSLTLCVDWLAGGAFLLKSASEIASYGSVSSFKMVKRGLSHRFLESGASNLSTNASKLQKTNQMSGTFKETKQNWMTSTVFVEASHSHVLGVLLSSISVGIPC